MAIALGINELIIDAVENVKAAGGFFAEMFDKDVLLKYYARGFKW